MGIASAFTSPLFLAFSNSRRNKACFSSKVLLLNLFAARKSGSPLLWSLNCKEQNTKICYSAHSRDRSNRYKNFLLSFLWLNRRFVIHCSFFRLKTECSPQLNFFLISLQKALRCAEGFNIFLPAFSHRVIVGVMIAMTLGATVTKSPSWALSEENLLFLEAWRTIDRAYIDKSFNGQSWFRYRENALRNEPMNSREETCIISFDLDNTS